MFISSVSNGPCTLCKLVTIDNDIVNTIKKFTQFLGKREERKVHPPYLPSHLDTRTGNLDTPEIDGTGDPISLH